ncbi:hypothetical protein B7P43_G04466 [Cryptotermes secundus]|uniref:DUF4817 domain-containing protein n=1 Tax=Cryptotermes secundus TaxID=105785 RepID=A0A2J7Q0U3_9NEOP|nr:hypothetical protein B7P43_G04466 [Cryptotermes secundus]
MATMKHKIFCIREFSKSESATAVQCAFRRKFNIQPPMRKSIYRWNKEFDETGSLCKGKSPGPSCVSEENVERIRGSFERSPMKSTPSASRELGLSQTTVWHVLRHRLVYTPYHLQLVQALRANDKVKRVEFCDLNRHNVRIWGLQNPRVTFEHVRDSPKVNVFCAILLAKVYGPFFFDENTVTGVMYLRMLQNWLVPQMNRFLNESLPQQWIGRMGNEDLTL